jgi:hypothetical protein
LQFISVDGGTSKHFDLKNGVPQGSCLGPLLFVLYVSKLFQILESHLPDAHAFADDNQLYVSFQPDSMSEQLTAVTVMENSGFVVSKTNKIQRLSKIFAAYFQRLFKDV